MTITEKIIKKIDKKIELLKTDEWLKEVEWDSIRQINNIEQYNEKILAIKINLEKLNK